MDQLCAARAFSLRSAIRWGTWSLFAILPVLLLSGGPLLAQALPTLPADAVGSRASAAETAVRALRSQRFAEALRVVDEALTPLVTTAGRLGGDVAAAGIRYAFAHGRHFAPHHARCRRVALVVRRPWLVGPAQRLARLAPALAARVVPLVIGGAPSPEAHG